MNAQGKTNIIEAAFLSAFGKSFRAKKERELIKENELETIIELSYEKEDREGKIKTIINDKKEVFINGIKIKKLSELLGKINIVFFCPDDINILKTGPASRRRFLNIMISQLRPMYVHLLNQYNKTIEQRNIYLKQIKYEGKSIGNLDIWDEQIVELGTKIYEYRKVFIEKINEKIYDIHLKTTENKEKIKVKYISNIRKQLFRKFEKK